MKLLTIAIPVYNTENYIRRCLDSLLINDVLEDIEIIAVNDGSSLKVAGDVSSAKVSATVVEQGRAKKVVVYKYKRKTGYHKKNGHRQPFTLVKIDKITL